MGQTVDLVFQRSLRKLIVDDVAKRASEIMRGGDPDALFLPLAVDPRGMTRARIVVRVDDDPPKEFELVQAAALGRARTRPVWSR